MTSVRCAAHPGRPAVDDCPVCGRPRCGADLQGGQGCTLCRAADVEGAGLPVRRKAPPSELLVRAMLAASAVAIGWAYVTSEYVGSDVFQYLSPGVLGILCGGAATAAAATPRRGRLATRVRAIGVLYAVLGSGLGFLLEGTYRPDQLTGDVLIAYAIAALAAWVWAAPPKTQRPARRR